MGRPFPLSEAAEHLGRLRAWGFNIVRLSVTWDALEHKGPKQYDRDYVSYVLDVVKACKTFGLYVYVDPHQDVWSRHCGGSGAPAWTLEKVGLDHSKFKDTGAAVTHHGVRRPKFDFHTGGTYPTRSGSTSRRTPASPGTTAGT